MKIEYNRDGNGYPLVSASDVVLYLDDDAEFALLAALTTCGPRLINLSDGHIWSETSFWGDPDVHHPSAFRKVRAKLVIEI